MDERTETVLAELMRTHLNDTVTHYITLHYITLHYIHIWNSFYCYCALKKPYGFFFFFFLALCLDLHLKIANVLCHFFPKKHLQN